MSYISFVNFIPNYFILFDAIVNGIISLISLLDCSLLGHRNLMSSVSLTLYPKTLLTSFISSYGCVYVHPCTLAYVFWRLFMPTCTERFIQICIPFTGVSVCNKVCFYKYTSFLLIFANFIVGDIQSHKKPVWHRYTLVRKNIS